MGSPFRRVLPPPERIVLLNPFPAHLMPESRRGLQYEVDWNEKSTLINGVKDHKIDPNSVSGKIPTELPEFLKDPKKALYVATGLNKIDNPVTGIAKAIEPVK
jgi:hypothetical protein